MKIKMIFLCLLYEKTLNSITLENVTEMHARALTAYNLTFHGNTGTLAMPNIPEQLPDENRNSRISFLNTTNINIIFDDFLNNIEHNPVNLQLFNLWMNNFLILIIRDSYHNRHPFRQGELTSTIANHLNQLFPNLVNTNSHTKALIQNLNIAALASNALPNNIDNTFNNLIHVDFNNNPNMRQEIMFLQNTLLAFS